MKVVVSYLNSIAFSFSYSRKKQENSTGNAPNDIQVVSQSDVFVSESTDVHPLFNFKAFKRKRKY